MARNGLGSFAGGFADAFSQIYFPAMQQEKTRKENEEFKKLQLKKIKTDLDLAEQQANARGTVLDRLSDERGPPMDLTTMLSRSPGLLLQSGLVDTKDLLQEQRLRSGQDIFKQLTQQFSGGNAGGTGFEGKVDPLSLLAATQSGDLGKLRSRDVATATIQTPEGPMVVQYPKDDPSQQTIVGPAKEEKVTPEQAGRLSGLVQASQLAEGFRQTLFDDSGNVALDQFDLFNMTMNTPNSKGRLLRNQYKDAIDAVLRARTGAAANADEQKSLLEQFMPMIGDNDKIILDKQNRLEAFVNGSLDIATLPKSLQDKFKKSSDSGFTSDDQKRLEELEKQLGGP